MWRKGTFQGVPRVLGLVVDRSPFTKAWLRFFYPDPVRAPREATYNLPDYGQCTRFEYSKAPLLQLRTVEPKQVIEGFNVVDFKSAD